MRITILALGSRGDVQPYAALGAGLRLAGHRVSFITSENYRSLISLYGLDPCLIPGDAEKLTRDAGARMSSLMRVFRDLSAELIQHSERVIPVLANSDLILNQLPGGAYTRDIHEKFGIPTWLVATIPLVQTSSFPMIGWPSGPSFVPGYNRTSYRVSEWTAWALLKSSINLWRTAVLNLPPASSLDYFSRSRNQPEYVLNGFSSAVFPRPGDWGKNIINTGYWFMPEEHWIPPDSLNQFLDSGPPPVFIGFGSMPTSNPAVVTNTLLEAGKEADCRVIIQSGWGGLGATSVPDNAFVLDYAPYEWLFPRMRAVIHHGGSGTTSAGLRAGIPSLIVPFLFDQFFWGNRIHDLGAGPRPLPFRKLTSHRLAGRMTAMLVDSDMRSRAAALGGKLRDEDGIETAVQWIESCV